MAATKIVIVAGQEFSVPAETENEAIRQQLSGMGFADVASATIQKGTREIDGVKYDTVEFIKKAGTKGLTGAELAAILGQVPRRAPQPLPGASRDGAALVQRWMQGGLTIGQALDARDQLVPALAAIEERQGRRVRSEGEQLCEPCDLVPAVAAPAPCAW